MLVKSVNCTSKKINCRKIKIRTFGGKNGGIGPKKTGGGKKKRACRLKPMERASSRRGERNFQRGKGGGGGPVLPWKKRVGAQGGKITPDLKPCGERGTVACVESNGL